MKTTEETKQALAHAEGSNIFTADFLQQFEIVKEKYPDWNFAEAQTVAKNRKKELEAQGYTVKVKRWNFIDLGRGYSYSVTAIKPR